MIRVICNQETFVYNAYHMVKAFYPSETVASSVDEKASNYVTVEFAEDGTDGQKEAMIEIADRQTNDMPAEKSAMKKYLDRMLYKKLSEQSGRTLAWGILMGVRPTKIAMRKLEEGMTQETFVPWFQKENLVSEEKAHLAWQIAGREKKLLDQLDYENGYSLYVGIPFCPTVCSYCSFSSGALGDWEHRVEDYLAALMKELEAIAKMSEGRKADTIYMGGGTPTTLNEDQLERLLTCIDRHFVREGLLEFTVEAGRPDSITKEKLQVLRNHGINRISINPQSMQQKTLDTIGRKHTVEQVYEAFHMARKLGFDNINMDIIAGLPGETPEDMEDTLRQIALLGPDNLTVHSLAIKRAAKMGQEEREGKRLTIIQDEIGTMVEMAGNKARQMGLFPYYLYRQKNIAGNFENVGYAKVDKAGIYNILIMEEKQSIIAAGAGASTKIVLKEPVINPESKKKKKNQSDPAGECKSNRCLHQPGGRDDRTKRRMAMALKKKPVTGMKDVMPAEMEIRDYLIGLIKDTYKTFGFQSMETPCVEHIENLCSKQGGDNEKLIFKILKRGEKLKIDEAKEENDLVDGGLRYDLTVPLARYYSNHANELPSPFKALQIGSVWRADRPQKGRFRQFVQCDIDILGEASNLAEIELILATTAMLGKLDFKNFTVCINDRNILKSMAAYSGFKEEDYDEVFIVLDKMDKIGPEGVEAELIEMGYTSESVKTYLSLFDEVASDVSGVRYLKEKLGDYLSDETADGLELIMSSVEAAKECDFKLQFTPTLVRGQSYYTGTIFEVTMDDFGGSVAGGGRYDKMIGKFTGQDTPACGFSIGFERIVMLLLENGYKVPGGRQKKAYLLEKKLPKEAMLKVLALAKADREAGRQVLIVNMKKNKKFQKEQLIEDGYTEIADCYADSVDRL